MASSQNERVAYDGAKFRITWSFNDAGNSQAADFYDDLSTKDQAKVITLFKYLADHGELKNKEKFKRIHDDLYEFKSFQVRLIGQFAGRGPDGKGRFVIGLGLLKRKNKHKKSDLDTAKKNILEYLNRERETPQ